MYAITGFRGVATGCYQIELRYSDPLWGAVAALRVSSCWKGPLKIVRRAPHTKKKVLKKILKKIEAQPSKSKGPGGMWDSGKGRGLLPLSTFWNHWNSFWVYQMEILHHWRAPRKLLTGSFSLTMSLIMSLDGNSQKRGRPLEKKISKNKTKQKNPFSFFF